MASLGILGTSPKGVEGLVRTGSFSQFQKILGLMESAPVGGYRVGHCACHAFMNGVQRVVFFGLHPEDLKDPQRMEQAVRKLVEDGPLDLIVSPEVDDIAHLDTLCETAISAMGQDEEKAQMEGLRHPPMVLVPSGPKLTTEEIVRIQEGWNSRAKGLARVVVPWVRTLTPGRRQAEPLPGICVAPALVLGCTVKLRGVHDLEQTHGQADVRSLVEAGVVVMEASGVRKQVGLVAPVGEPFVSWTARFDSEQPPPANGHSIEEKIAEAVETICRDAMGTRPSGPALWSSLERSVQSFLMPLKHRGDILAFHVRCNEETNDGLQEGVGIEVLYRLPVAVRQVNIRLHHTG